MGSILSLNRLTPNSGPTETKFREVRGGEPGRMPVQPCPGMALVLVFFKLAFCLKCQAGVD